MHAQIITLRGAAVENETVLGEASASALRHNFDVDDLTNSMKDLDSNK